MGSCGSIKYTEGATLENSTVVNSTVQGSTISDSTVNSVSITNLTSLDDSSAKTILSALLDQDLQALADALMPLMSVSTTTAPSTTDNSEIPVNMAGSRDFLLGKPDQWLEIGGGKVPSYN